MSTDADTPVEDDTPVAGDPVALAMFEERLQALAQKERLRVGRENMWTAHHWPEDYGSRTMKWGHRHVCRRCGVLYPIGVTVALLFSAGTMLWPESWDPAMIWALCLPATVAYCGEAAGLFGYNRRWQMMAMAVTALAFGRGLGYEFNERWSSEFWGPVAVFGGVWFAFTMIANLRRKKALKTDGD